MSLVKATGNMYPWVTHCHSHLRGACPHKCPYCYATKGRAKRFAQGPLEFLSKELDVGYGSRDGVPKTIFEEYRHDLCAPGVRPEWVQAIMRQCRKTPSNWYVFQTRNTLAFDCHFAGLLPPKVYIGTTIETNREAPGFAPAPVYRAKGLHNCGLIAGAVTFLTIEPVLDFDTDELLDLIWIARPAFVNIGADSKRCGLAEPSAEKVLALIAGIQKLGIEIREKKNLDRILKGGAA